MKNAKKKEIIFRISEPLRKELFTLLLMRYPKKEWGTFARIGFHETSSGLTLTLCGLDVPIHGDLNMESWINEIQAQYTSRILINTETHPFAVGFIHSHPQEFSTEPSPSDYDMENYYAKLLGPYTNDKPFASLIFAQSEAGVFSATGRVFWNNKWYEVNKFIVEGIDICIGDYTSKRYLDAKQLKKISRLASQFSIEAANKLAGSVIGIVGASGTGSPCIELLARAGVGTLVIIDPEIFEDSNLERLHGSIEEDISKKIPKVSIAGRHIKSINPKCEIVLIKGRLPQKEVINELVKCDIVIGATDLHSSRVALSDLSSRFLVPVIDTGVVMEGKDGQISGQIIQINRLFPKDPCVYCRNMINSQIVNQELMTPEEQQKLIEEARKASKDGRDHMAYWLDMPQLNTVGYLTTMAGSMVVNYVIGYITDRFKMNSNRIEINFSKVGIQVVETNAIKDPDCRCHLNTGTADQDFMAISSIIPNHWQKAVFVKI